MPPTTPGRPDRGPSWDRRPRLRSAGPLVFAATVLLASGGVGVAAASAASPVSPSTPAPTPTTTDATPAPTPTTTDTATPAPTDTSTATPVPTDTATPAPQPTPVEVPRLDPRVFAGALHGEFSVPTKDGCGTLTLLAQTGEATAVTEDSITVRSRDGFEKVYAITEDTRVTSGHRNKEVRQGEWTSVIATTEGETATAAYLTDLTRPAKNFWRSRTWWYRAWQNPVPSIQGSPEACPTPPTTPSPTPTDTATPTPSVTPTETPTTPEPTPTTTDTTTPAPTPSS
ncbi:hypothetical protein [Sphaerisporangium fuscum]|uniref:hypothetical protein n=1 Tax=Sphaerisporangium fuscum TaxID=2835868 RepID=UPI001BDC1FCD|nr:hypothetical protein [Sphaerisporangium fuscum]